MTDVHRITLELADPVLEREYRDASAASSVKQNRIWALVWLLVWVQFGAWDWLVLPEHTSTLWTVRFGVAVPVILIWFALTWLPMRIYRRTWQGVLMAVDLSLVGCLCLFQALLPMETAHYSYVPIMMMNLVFAATTFLRFVHTAALALLTVLLYEVVVLVVSPIPARLAINATFWLVSAGVGSMFIAYMLEWHRRRDFLQQKQIEEGRARADRLLFNMLPEPIANRLMDGAGAIADGFEEVTVMFGDIVGFTALSERLTPVELVTLLNRLFSSFDEMAQRRGLEKIKTIGDAYMVVGGLPTPRADHAHAVADMALEMTRSLSAFGDIRMRIGIHTGSVVAGVIGKRRYIYDLWGDTVNLASRMESHGVGGAIQVSEETYRRLRDDFDLEARGPVEIKGKGAIATYLLKDRKVARAAS